MPETRALMTIAGTDPSGGAGIPVDLQVFRDFAFHGLSAVSAIVWQNTVGVRGYRSTEAEHLGRQVDAVLEDIPVSGVKIGMLGTAANAAVVADRLERRDGSFPVVLDPVLAGGGSGEALSEGGLVGTVRERLLPRVSLVTPNLPEAEALVDRSIETADEMENAAEHLVDLGADAALVTAGHFSDGDTIRDLLAVQGRGIEWLEPLRRLDADVRGTGCQLSSAATARLARGDSPRAAAEAARHYLHALLGDSTAAIGTGRPFVVRTRGPSDSGAEP
jgi:hydroxymethylpyrimidine/phosphomethylpyrimidine kinase